MNKDNLHCIKFVLYYIRYRRGDSMLLAIDVGNTNIVMGVFDNDKLITSGRLSTDIYQTDEEYAMKINSFLVLHRITNIDSAILSSVVPALVRTLKNAVKLITKKDCLVVGPGVKTGLSLKIDNPSQLGSDLVVGAVAAKQKYPLPIILFDLGTATTATIINKNGEFIGGMIMAGVKTSMNALTANTAQLPQIDISAPSKLIGTNTIDCMKCGAVIATASMLDGLVERFEEILNEKASCVITGGLAGPIVKYCRHNMIVDENLLLDGLNIIHNKNKNS